MFRSLRNRLILSHILPSLLIIPLMGAAMVYVLETRLLLPMVYSDLAKDATLMATITRNQLAFWRDSEVAQALVYGVSPYLSGKVSFIALDGRVLASSDSTDRGLNTQTVDLPDMTDVAQGELVELQRGRQAEVFTPVFDLNGKPIGIIRMTTLTLTVSDEVYQLRYLLGAVLLLSVLAGIGLGSYLAFSINRPIQRATHSIQSLADGDWQEHVQEQGPEEIHKLTGTVNTLIDRLNSLEKSRRQLLANLVHELGTPLGAIRSAIQALLKGANKDPKLSSDLLAGLDSETIRLQRLLDDLAELHDQVLGKLELKRETVQLNEWLTRVMSPWEMSAQEKGLVWKIEVQQDLPDVFMDSDRMAQAVGNLVSNAVKFTPAGGKVTTTVKFMDKQLVIQVADSGPGIPLEEQNKVFQPFYRGSHGRRIVQGMGLGLSIAHDIATAHGGKIDLQSAPGAGCQFILQIPFDVST